MDWHFVLLVFGQEGVRGFLLRRWLYWRWLVEFASFTTQHLYQLNDRRKRTTIVIFILQTHVIIVNIITVIITATITAVIIIHSFVADTYIAPLQVELLRSDPNPSTAK